MPPISINELFEENEEKKEEFDESEDKNPHM